MNWICNLFILRMLNLSVKYLSMWKLLMQTNSMSSGNDLEKNKKWKLTTSGVAAFELFFFLCSTYFNVSCLNFQMIWWDWMQKKPNNVARKSGFFNRSILWKEIFLLCSWNTFCNPGTRIQWLGILWRQTEIFPSTYQEYTCTMYQCQWFFSILKLTFFLVCSP